MARKDFSEYLLYRWRFIIGYTAIALLLAGLLVFAGLYVPGGLSQGEKAAVITSEAIDLTNIASFAIPHLPYHLLQAGIFSVVGVSEFTIKLPSLLLGLFSAIGLIILLRRWFPHSIAVLASLIAVATGQFLYIAQSGTPAILYVFWPVALLLIGTMVTRASRGKLFWKFLFAATAAASLYSPLSIYMLIAVLVTTILHPHLRNVIRRLSKPKLAISIVLALLIVAPLAYFVYLKPTLGIHLLGLPASLQFDWQENLNTLVAQYFMFWDPTVTRIMTPVFGLGTVMLILLGLYRLIRTRETTRSYLVISWLICLIPIILVNPQYVTILFVPSVLLIAAGLTSLIGYWYRLFPLNPYARIAGLIPIIVLVATLIGSGIDRYVYGYHYSPNVATSFSRDLSLLPDDTDTLVVSEGELPFYRAVTSYDKDFTVSTTLPADESFVATREGRGIVDASYEITNIVTNQFADDADRFYEYTKRSQ